MPQLNWDETDFLDCLEVMPDVEEYEVRHCYEVNRDEISLTVIVWQLESAVHLQMSQRGKELMRFVLFVRGPVRYINDKRGRYLEFQDSIMAPDRFSYMSIGESIGDVFDKYKFKYGLTVRMQVSPYVHIALSSD